MKRMGIAVLGIGGVAVLLALGVWQVQRLEWKQGILARIEARLAADPGPLPVDPDPATDSYLGVSVTGRTTGEELHVLTSRPATGAGYRVIVPFETEGGRRMMADLGYVPDAEKTPPRAAQRMTLTGNLVWPDDRNRWTPEPDRGENIWYARDVAPMAEALGTEPLMIVARRMEPAVPGITPLPVDTAGIPNNHLNYAITWFALAAIWAGMTALALWRMRKRPA